MLRDPSSAAVRQCVLAALFAFGLHNSSVVSAALAQERPSDFASAAEAAGTKKSRASRTSQAAAATGKPPRQQAQQPPNIVIVLTDDLDWTIGGANASTLSRTRRWIGDGGKVFSNWFVQTPVCCPSRAELLTGRAYHNLRVPGPATEQPGGCMHVDVADTPSHPFYNRHYFAPFFSRSSTLPSNYTVRVFGKHLNNGNPRDFVPRGVDEMLINGGGTYLDPTFTHGKRRKTAAVAAPGDSDSGSNGGEDKDDDDDCADVREVTFDDCTETTGMPCYSTSVIGNASLARIRRQVQQQQQQQDGGSGRSTNHRPLVKPFMALISVKAPHLLDGSEFAMAIPAPWYVDGVIPERSAPRTPNYNRTTTLGPATTTPDGHHWLVRTQPSLTEEQAQRVDDLYVSRLKALISVDDLVDDLIHTLEGLGVLENTYVLFTSDNGYRLGQFRMPSCKLHPYENDVRVPMMVRGPGIRPGGTSDVMATHVDLIPTLLGLAAAARQGCRHEQQDGSVVPPTMDGTNLAWAVVDAIEDGHEDGTTDDGGVDERGGFVAAVAGSDERERPGVDGRSLMATTSTSDHARPNSILIEYTSLGDVVRYQHLVDTYNHSFLALRMILPQAGGGGGGGDAAAAAGGHGRTALPPPPFLRNLKYIEFRDSRDDWNSTGPPLERELYDLEDDPYEMDNLIYGDNKAERRVSPAFLALLHDKVQRMVHCMGDTCRGEATTGLMGVTIRTAQEGIVPSR